MKFCAPLCTFRSSEVLQSTRTRPECALDKIETTLENLNGIVVGILSGMTGTSVNSPASALFTDMTRRLSNGSSGRTRKSKNPLVRFPACSCSDFRQNTKESQGPKRKGARSGKVSLGFVPVRAKDSVTLCATGCLEAYHGSFP